MQTKDTFAKTQTTKIFFSDLDGTLLNDKKEVTPLTRAALDQWTGLGHKFVLCSGRPLPSVKDVKKELHLSYPGMYLVGYNGGEIYECDTDRVLYQASLTLEQTSFFLKEAAAFGIHCHTYTEDLILTPADNEQVTNYRRTNHMAYQVVPGLADEILLGKLSPIPYKCLVIELHDTDKLEAFRLKMQPIASRMNCTILYSNKHLLEIFPAFSGKGSAVRKLCDLLHIPTANAVAAGDQANDLSMLEAAGTGVAMLNATEEVKKAATLVTAADNNHDGLAAVLKALK